MGWVPLPKVAVPAGDTQFCDLAPPVASDLWFSGSCSVFGNGSPSHPFTHPRRVSHMGLVVSFTSLPADWSPDYSFPRWEPPDAQVSCQIPLIGLSLVRGASLQRPGWPCASDHLW